MRVLRFVAIGALIAAGIIARTTTPSVSSAPPVIESRPHSIVCDPSGRCIAVGLMGSVYGVHVPYAAELVNGSWTLLSPQLPTPVVDSEFASVECDAPDRCVAVGREEIPAPYLGARSAGDRPLIQTWDGSAWVRGAPTIPTGSKDAGLNGVACASSTCMAVGQYGKRVNKDRALATTSDGARWTLALPPYRRVEEDAGLNDVVCFEPTSCLAVGQFGFELQAMFTGVAPLIERWDGSAWHLEPSSNAKDSLDTELNAISCPTEDRCLAVGFRRLTGGAYATFAEIRNGRRWSLLPTVDPPNSPDVEFADIACPERDRCVAVGSWTSGAQIHSLVERWDGEHWTIERTPVPSTATSSALTSIDCPTTQSCYAVGAYEQGSPTEHAFSLAWDGRAWKVIPMPESSDTA